ncbi:hypothetical protein ACJQWK_11539 [Exserohilum turcicum]|uniref:Uncharacterized protein n=1 Tax=Exserohilum turcicum (strain 28A) TaxID=671987 RepID=R0KDB3_EXST2|nr:uncharacterized protein SETTUDRAFT_25010 [Exserohilum turcica Et28A]EOA90908.1 hypothetical protein SETTUDRAFT_25010 [Exserohilum turcica Et28A]
MATILLNINSIIIVTAIVQVLQAILTICLDSDVFGPLAPRSRMQRLIRASKNEKDAAYRGVADLLGEPNQDVEFVTSDAGTKIRLLSRFGGCSNVTEVWPKNGQELELARAYSLARMDKRLVGLAIRRATLLMVAAVVLVGVVVKPEMFLVAVKDVREVAGCRV